MNTSSADQDFKAGIRAMWAMGDYDTFSRQLMWEIGPIVAEAAGAGPGKSVLDVAAGTGNTAIRAAQAGAQVVASDLTPEHFEAGRANARAASVELQWVEADAEALPFGDAQFDIVTSSFGAIFAPRHQKVADELLRVCRPGGRIVMANFAVDSLLGDFFSVFAPHMPPPRDGDLPPTLWGDPAHVRGRFGSRVAGIQMTRRSYTERAETPRAYCELFKRNFGPVVAVYAGLRDRPEEQAALDASFVAFAERCNSAAAGEPASYIYDYLLVVADKRGD